MSIDAATSTDLATTSASDVATSPAPSEITQPTGLLPAQAPAAPVRRPSGVARYFRKARDRASREATTKDVPANLPADTTGASTSASKTAASEQALQAAENEGWK